MLERIVKGISNPREAVTFGREKFNRKRSERWCAAQAVSVDYYASQRDADLWKEVQQYSDDLQCTLLQQYHGLDTSTFNPDAHVGGGAAYGLLHFITLLKQPKTVVETGVAAGWSSRGILDALNKNGAGELYSNDLPYSDRPAKRDTLHIDRDEVGILVDENHCNRWELSLGPDRDNLPNILESIDSIDIFHYDSDKSYTGREFGMRQVRQQLHEQSIVVMDDIEDNLFFRDFVTKNNVDYAVLDSDRSKIIGIIEGAW